MHAAEARELFESASVARLATCSADGQPHIVPITFAVAGDVIFTAVDHKPKRTMRLRRLENIERNPRVSVLADHYEDDWSQLWWVRADGTARIADPGSREHGRAVSELAARYPQYRQRAPGGPAIAVTVTGWTGWRAVS